MLEAREVGQGRHAGVLVPLFSIPSRRSWGIGEIPDLEPLSRWLESAGMAFTQLLPVNEMQEGQSSPYSALSAMAIDPIFIAASGLPEITGIDHDGLTREERARIDEARGAASVQYGVVRAVKSAVLRRAFAAYERDVRGSGSPRDLAFQEFAEREGWWLHDYALFRALHEERNGRHWQEWEPPLRNRDPDALQAAREHLAGPVRYYSWLQWAADEQWRRMRAAIAPTAVLGDFPFMVSGHSADVWARQHEFRIDVSVGVPPDAFSETGQDWGLPLYRWDTIARGGDEWLRMRARRCAELYDGFRIDHLVGFYRTFYREAGGASRFDPADEPSQLAQGERLMETLSRESGALLIAEDLGVVPDFVRESIARLGIPGLKVFRWEREWEEPGRPFRDPSMYPARSVAISGTHDTEPLAVWWDDADADERRAVLQVAALRECGDDPDQPFSSRLRDALLDALYGAQSDLVIVPVQDAFGWRDRINTPAVVSDENWTWRLPWPVDELSAVPEAAERARFLRDLARKHRRV